MADTNDGFVIAERDLQLRGPGDFFGTRQHGLPQLRAGDLDARRRSCSRWRTARRAKRVDEGTLTDADARSTCRACGSGSSG